MSKSVKVPPANTSTLPVATIILAAGVASRMGNDKTQLTFGNSITFAGALISHYREFSYPLIVVANPITAINFKDFTKHIALLINNEPEKGRPNSIRLGLSQIPKGVSCFLHNIDNPYVSRELHQQLMDNIHPDGFVVPYHAGRGGHPILIGHRMVEHLRMNGEWNDFREEKLKFKKVVVPWANPQVLLNINTPEDYISFLKNNRDY